ncbi:hypothetical protein GCM10027259_61540 [Micromonospora palomenae]|uniref:hypothetical protein n=1 Tax=Micromonospora palomenae TaxID=1461247 RepID=UPI0012B7B9AC|nr:hypothetical protein [Micromonospora palomenae]
MLIRKLIVAALEAGDAHTDLGKAFGTRSVISFRYLAEERATGIFSGVSPAAHSLAAIRAARSVTAGAAARHPELPMSGCPKGPWGVMIGSDEQQ